MIQVVDLYYLKSLKDRKRGQISQYFLKMTINILMISLAGYGLTSELKVLTGVGNSNEIINEFLLT